MERANGALQDRLVKELRLRGIADVASANAFLPACMADYNARFRVVPASPVDAHRPVLHTASELDLIFSPHAARKVSKNLTFRYRNREYQLQGQGRGYRLRGAAVTVCEGFNGVVEVLHKGRVMACRVLADWPRAGNPSLWRATRMCAARWTGPGSDNRPARSGSRRRIIPGSAWPGRRWWSPTSAPARAWPGILPNEYKKGGYFCFALTVQ